MAHPDSTSADCPFCAATGEEVLFEDSHCRVILVTGEDAVAFPGFCRVVWHGHVREMSDLDPHQQRHLLDVVLAVERVIRKVQQPDKINIASLGNVVPHLHWHIIPRWFDDSHFPRPIWAAAQRRVVQRQAVDKLALRTTLKMALRLEESKHEI